MSLTGCWALPSLRGSWCLEALECESRDSVCCLTGGMEGGLWEDSSSQIVEVLWKSESKRMAEELASCPSLSSFFPGPVQRVTILVGLAWAPKPRCSLRWEGQHLLSCVQALCSGRYPIFSPTLVTSDLLGMTSPG